MRLALALLIALSPLVALAKPADITAAVAAPDRPAKDRAMDEGRHPAEVLGFERLAVGDRVLDWMAGGGYYSEIMARAVGPAGSVVALNPPGFAKATADAWTERRARVPNIELLTTPFAEAALPRASFDFALFHIVYHDLYWTSAEEGLPRVEPRAILANLYAAMKPGGVVAVIDHVGPRGDTRAIVDKLHRIDPETIKTDFARVGFRLEGQSRLLRNAADDHTKLVFDPAIRGKTDRVIYRFVKP